MKRNRAVVPAAPEAWAAWYAKRLLPHPSTASHGTLADGRRGDAMVDEHTLRAALGKTLDHTDLPALGEKYEGKVRDNYSRGDGASSS